MASEATGGEGRKSKKSAGRYRLPYGKRVLHDPSIPEYYDQSLKMISFPLGGIGTGTIGLGGRGELRDWEIFNGPNLDYRPPYTMPFLFTRQANRKRAFVLERQLLGHFHSSGGLRPQELPGLPRLKDATFIGLYPLAEVAFEDKRPGVEVTLTAFNPMIPHNADESAIPAAILVYTLRNPGKKPIAGSIALSMANVIGVSGDGLGGNVNEFRAGQAGPGDVRPLSGIYMTSQKYAPDHPAYGSMALCALEEAANVSWLTDTGQHTWFDAGQSLWDDFRADGRFEASPERAGPTEKHAPIAALAVPFRLAGKESRHVIFVLAWSFPTRLATWNLPKDAQPRPVRNHYARRFGDAWTAARHVADNFDPLYAQTRQLESALLESTLPGDVIDAVSSQMSIIRTNTTMWLDSPEGEEPGRLFGFEGCNAKAGCCPMNCTHVWNYEQSLAHLYPSLERSMRLTDYLDNLQDGAMSFRTILPLGAGLPLWRPELPCADGQFGTVVKVHREWRLSGDDAFLRRLWPAVKQSVQFAWNGFARWDADKDGVLEGVQHNTYDIEFHGPNTMCGALYLAALAAAAEMAKAVGDDAATAEFLSVYQSGRQKYDQLLWNGEYYVQHVQPQANAASLSSPTQEGQPPGRQAVRYQYGQGCLSDQLLGQWAAHVAGLGYVLPPAHVRKAMRSIFRHNFRADLSEHESCQRVYALNEEAGLLLCTWPRGQREQFPFPYSDETWTGIEYQVAAHLIYEGMIDEGLCVVRAARERHDGIARNPWNEFECGDHYARAMSSWSVLLALSGQRYDGRSKTLFMRPVINKDDFRCLVTAADGYGMYRQAIRLKDAGGKVASVAEVECLGGTIELAGLELDAALYAGGPVDGQAAGEDISPQARVEGDHVLVRLERPVTLRPGERLTIVFGGAGKRGK